MLVAFNFPDITSIPWLPVKFTTVGGDYETVFTPLVCQGGVKFGLNSCLQNFRDVSFNKKTGMFLTDLTNTSSVLRDARPPDSNIPLTEILTPVATIDYPYDKIVSLSTNLQLSATIRASENSTGFPTSYSIKDSFNFIFSKDTTHTLINNAEEDLVSVQTLTYSKSNQEVPNQFLLTWNVENNELVFKSKIFPESYSQKFAYLLSEDGICLFKPNTNYSVILSRNPDNNTFVFSTFSPLPAANATIPKSAFLKFVSYKHSPLNSSSVKDSYLTKYVVNKLDFQQELVQDEEISKAKYAQNFLGIFPFENPHIEEGYASYDLQIHGLKNYQTAEYNYSYNKNYVDGLSGVHRVYDRIFSGTNQKEGLTNVHLGYTANTSEIKFPCDQETWFNFAPTSVRIPLSASGLIEDGAIPGHHPYIADRIYLREIDYTSQLRGVPQPPSITKYSNTWLCSWLSGANGRDSAWMDRFYNAAYFTSDQALCAGVVSYQDRIDPNSPYIIDVPSSMYLEPGAFYRYYHGGIKTSQSYLPFLDGNLNSPFGSKILHISAWDTNLLKDYSEYHNNGLVYTEDAKPQDVNFWDLNGTTHAVFPAKSVLLEHRHFTTSLWIKVKDWNDIHGNQIFGNFSNSGYGLVNETDLTAPLISFVESTNGQLYNFNYQLKVVNFSDIPVDSETKNLIIIRYPDFSYWVFDTKNAVGNRFDIEGRKISTIPVKYYGVTQIETDTDQNLYLFQPRKKQVIVLTQYGNVHINPILLFSESVKRIEIFQYKDALKSPVIEIFGNASAIDNTGNVWQVLGNNLYKTPYNSLTDTHGSPSFFATLGITQQITCDRLNNLWFLHDQDKISILNISNGSFKTFRKGKRSHLPEDPCLKTPNRFRYINFVKTPLNGSSDCVDYTFKDLAVVIDSRDKELLLMDLNGDIITKIDLSLINGLKSSNPQVVADGDFTGYQFLRKFKNNNRNLSWKFKIGKANGGAAETLSLNYDTSLLHPGWHHFVFNFNAERGYAKYYIDSILVDQKFFSPEKQLLFDYRSSLLLGAKSVNNSVLNDLINIQDAYKFIGQVADLRIYNKSLAAGDIEQVYFSFDLSDDRKPLIWNMSSGKRNYIEEIQHWFQMQLPGSKSKYFNINVHNLPVSEEVKLIIEDALRKNITKLAPAYTSLYKINWL